PLTMICPVEDERQENATVPWMIWSGEALADGCLLFKMVSWVSGTLNNMIPSFVLLIFTLLLASEMIKAITVVYSTSKVCPFPRFEDSHRTTRMIIAVAVITLVSELPPGTLRSFHSPCCLGAEKKCVRIVQKASGW
ncbi:hypothetical protein PMAYCL1PPCAC_04915, partial [Pristionchus mayeri]